MNSSRKEKNNRILLVDDESDVLEFLTLFLHSQGWEVKAVSSVSAALEELATRSYFLVQTDIAMPEMDGYEFVSLLKERDIPSQIALMTGFGYNPNHTLVRINRELKYPILFKPFDCAKLIDAVTQAWLTYNDEFLLPGEKPPASRATPPAGPCGPESVPSAS